MTTLYVMVGIPGSGKSTVANTIIAEDKNEAIWVSTDKIREELGSATYDASLNSEVFGRAFTQTSHALKEGKDVVFDATSISVSSRIALVRRFHNLAKCVAVYVSAPIEVCKERNAQRSRSIPNDIIDRMARFFTAPTYDEGFSEIIYVNTVQ